MISASIGLKFYKLRLLIDKILKYSLKQNTYHLRARVTGMIRSAAPPNLNVHLQCTIPVPTNTFSFSIEIITIGFYW